MVLLLKHSEVLIAIVATDQMVKLRQTVSGGRGMITAVRCVGVRRYADASCRYGGGTAARWQTRWHGGAPGDTVVRLFHGGAPGGTVVSRCRTR